MKAGKDVYCEKPMVHAVHEGHAVIETQHQTSRILQSAASVSVRSSTRKRAICSARAPSAISTWWRPGGIGIPPSAPGSTRFRLTRTPTTCDWTQFQGDAPKIDWDPHRFFRWRCYRDYGTGVAGDLLVHLFSGTALHHQLAWTRRVCSPRAGCASGRMAATFPTSCSACSITRRRQQHPAFNLVDASELRERRRGELRASGLSAAKAS